MHTHTRLLKNRGDKKEEEECVRNHVVRASKANDIVRFPFSDLLSFFFSRNTLCQRSLNGDIYIDMYLFTNPHVWVCDVKKGMKRDSFVSSSLRQRRVAERERDGERRSEREREREKRRRR